MTKSAPYGALTISIEGDQVVTRAGAIPNRGTADLFVSRAILFNGQVGQIEHVFSPDVEMGYIRAVLFVSFPETFAIFEVIKNPNRDMAAIVMNGTDYKWSGMIPYAFENGDTVDLQSVIYDETIARLYIEASGSPHKGVHYVDLDWRSGSTVIPTPAQIDTQGVILTDVVPVFYESGDEGVLLVAFNEHNGVSTLFDGDGNEVLKISGANPVANSGFKTVTGGDDLFDTIILNIDGKYVAQRIDSRLHGSIESVWTTNMPAIGSIFVNVVASQGDIRMIATLQILKGETTVYAYRNQSREEYKASTAELIATTASPVRPPHSGVMGEQGHWTASVAMVEGAPVVVFQRYDPTGELVAEYPVPIAGTRVPSSQDKLVRYRAPGVETYSFGDVSLDALNGISQYNAGATTLTVAGPWHIIYRAEESALLAHNVTTQDEYAIQPLVDHYVAIDDVLGGFAFTQDPQTGNYDVRYFVFDASPGNEGWGMTTLLTGATLAPSHCDTYECDGELRLVSAGNWLTGDTTMLATYSVDLDQAQLTLLEEHPLPQGKGVIESLRAERSKDSCVVAWTAEPNTWSSVGNAIVSEDFPESVVVDTRSMAAHLKLLATGTQTRRGDLLLTDIVSRRSHGGVQVDYIVVYNDGSVTSQAQTIMVGSLNVEIPVGESRVIPLGVVNAGFASASAPYSVDEQKAFDSLDAVLASGAGYSVQAGTVAGMFNVSTAILQSSFSAHWSKRVSIFGLDEPTSGSLFILDTTNGTLHEIESADSDINAIGIAVKAPRIKTGVVSRLP